MNEAKVLVCVTRQKTCERLIREGAALAQRQGCELSVVHVAEQGADFLGIPEQAQAIEYLFAASKAVDAELTILRAEHVMDTLVAFAKQQQVTTIVTGVSPGKAGTDFAGQLRLRLPDVIVHPVFAGE